MEMREYRLEDWCSSLHYSLHLEYLIQGASLFWIKQHSKTSYAVYCFNLSLMEWAFIFAWCSCE